MSGYGANQRYCCEVEPENAVNNMVANDGFVSNTTVKEQLENIQTALKETQFTLERIVRDIAGGEASQFKDEEPKCMNHALFAIKVTAETCMETARQIESLLL